MSDSKSGTNRRDFITKIVPACAITCLAGKAVFASPEIFGEQEKHMFDEEFRTLTHKQFFGLRYQEFIGFARGLENELGNEETIELIKNIADKRMLQAGKNQAKQFGKNDLQSFVGQFKTGYKNTLNKSIVEDNENAFELKVTECIWAKVFRDAKAEEFGFAHICYGDYA